MFSEYGFLKTRAEDADFHANRVTFWVVDGEIKITPRGSGFSHLEIAEKEGWIDGKNTEEFFRKNMRGFFLGEIEGDRIHFYRDLGFGFDEETVALAIKMLPEFVEILGLKPKTRVFFGPKDSPINGVEYPIRFEGTINEILQRGK